MPVDSVDDDFATGHGTVVDRTSNFVWKILNMIPVVCLVRGPDARIPTATVQQHVFHILCRWQESKKSEECQLKMGTRHIPGTYLACHFKVFFVATSFGRSCSENSAMAPPNSLRDLLHLVQPPYRKKELRDARWEKLVQPPLSPILIPIYLGFWCIIYTLIYTLIYT